MNSGFCHHVSNYLNEKSTNLYKIIHAFFVVCVAKGSLEKKIKFHVCYECGTRAHRIHACLSCVYFGCFDNGHIHQHAKNNNHVIAMETVYGNLFCCECKDYMYHDEFEKIAAENDQMACKIFGVGKHIRRVTDWKERNLIKECDLGPKIERRYHAYFGLRGLVNMGSTCFMNCILQAFTHAPTLRDYFFIEEHGLQTYTDDSKKTCHEKVNPSLCVVCEMGNIFQQLYSGKSIPYTPSKLFYIICNHAPHLGGNRQHDAHEFFSSCLDILHEQCKGSEPTAAKCTCIVHKIYAGFLRSDLKCNKCNNLSTKFDEFTSLSLSLDTPNKSDGISLTDCLLRYTLPEEIQSNCNNCSYMAAMKQLTIKELPIILTFHLKRLDSVPDDLGKKNSTCVSFPEVLDMMQFMCTQRAMFKKPDSPIYYHNEAKYYLFAVVVHRGIKGGGHYFSYVKQHTNRWFKCNDDKITRIHVNSVLQEEGYMLFYHKQGLRYEYGK